MERSIRSIDEIRISNTKDVGLNFSWCQTSSDICQSLGSYSILPSKNVLQIIAALCNEATSTETQIGEWELYSIVALRLGPSLLRTGLGLVLKSALDVQGQVSLWMPSPEFLRLQNGD